MTTHTHITYEAMRIHGITAALIGNTCAHLPHFWWYYTKESKHVFAEAGSNYLWSQEGSDGLPAERAPACW